MVDLRKLWGSTYTQEQLADLAYESYDFGEGLSVTDAQPFDKNDESQWERVVYLDDANSNGDTIRVSFHVSFDSMGKPEGSSANDLESGNEIGECGLGRALFAKFRDVPVNNDDEIEKPFLHFDKGESRFQVWQWFEDQFGHSISDLLHGPVTLDDNELSI